MVFVSEGSNLQSAAPLLALSSLSPRPLRFFLFNLFLVSQFYFYMYLLSVLSFYRYAVLGAGFAGLSVTWHLLKVRFCGLCFSTLCFFWLLDCGFCVSIGNMNLLYSLEFIRWISYIFTFLVNVSYDL